MDFVVIVTHLGTGFLALPDFFFMIWLLKRLAAISEVNLDYGAPFGLGGLGLGRGGLLLLLPKVNLHVPPPLIAACELPPTLVAGERLLPGVRADVRGQVVAPAEVAHADAALERLVAGVDAQVPAQLVRPGEPAVAALRRARIRSLVHGGLARAIRVLPGS